MGLPDILPEKRQEILEIAAKHGAYNVRLFGSVARGEAEVEKDREREVWLSTQGFTALRFWNNEIMQNLEGVLEVIRENILRI